jgi:RHS repeat-associated protein
MSLRSTRRTAAFAMSAAAYTVVLCFLIFGSARQSEGQFAPGSQADAMNPSGAPDPMKADQIWQVDPITGALSVKIPFGTTPQGGRGPKIPFALSYNSSSTVSLQSAGTNVMGSSLGMQCYLFVSAPASCEFTGTYLNANTPTEVLQNFQWTSGSETSVRGPTGPWTTTGPFSYYSQDTFPNSTITFGNNGNNEIVQSGCTINGPYIYVDENGGAHDMNLNNIFSVTPENDDMTGPCFQTVATTGMTGDGSALITSVNSPVIVYPNGTKLTSSSPYTLEDSNGNIATLSEDSLGRTPFTTNIPMGAPGPIPAGNYSVATTGATGAQESYSVVVSPVTLGSFTMPHPASGSEVENPPGYCLVICPTQIGIETLPTNSTINGVTSISLPDGTSYGFNYDPTYGTISQINFPTGGYVRFVYGIRGDGGGYGPFIHLSTITVTDAYISDGVTGEKHWHYQFPSYSGSGQLTSTVTSPDGTTTQYVGVPYNYDGYPWDESSAPTWKETQRTITSSSGTLMESVFTKYNPAGTFPQQVATTRYVGSALVQQQDQYGYDYPTYSLVIEKDESDIYPCGSGCSASSPPQTLASNLWLRHTYTTYWSGGTIIDRPSQVLVTDGYGVPASLTNYTYDQTANFTNTPTGVPTHDYVNYGTAPGTPRGDVTTESRCITMTGNGPTATCSSSSTTWQISYTYDLTGQLVSKTEGSNTSKAATTVYTWGGKDGGFLTMVTYPNTATDSYTYFTPTGEMETHTDWNNNTTTYAYNDPLNRLTSITDPSTTDGCTGSPAQGSTNYNYTDTAGGFEVQAQSAVCSSTKTSTITSYDGLGRKVETLTAAPQCSGGIEVNTAYDSMSRVSSVSSPYCSGGSAGSLTEFDYDALSRKTSATTTFDGATTSWTYAGFATEITEPSNGFSNVQLIQQPDGLGRLTSVCEVTATLPGGISAGSCGQEISGTGYLTSYQYDAVNDLVSVLQAQTQTRSFTYDGLSRLQLSTNPETGSKYSAGTTTLSGIAPVQYFYSSSGSACSPDSSSVCTKIDVRGFTTNYQYDKMARLTGKSYSPPSGPTDLSACFNYDKAVSSDSNAWGALTMSWLQSGVCPGTPPVSSIPPGAFNIHLMSSHDAMGRAAVDQQCLSVAGCPSSSVGAFSYSYDLLGGQVQSNNGVPSGTVSATASDTTNSSPATLPSVTWRATYDNATQLSSVYVQSQPTTSVWSPTTFLADPTLMAANATAGYDPFGHLVNAQLGLPYGLTSSAVQMTRTYDPKGRITSETDNGTGASSGATQSLGTIVIVGSEQGPTYPASSYARATVTIGGSEQTTTVNPCQGNPVGSCPYQQPDAGSVTITVNGIPATSSYSQGSTSAQMASNLAGSINGATNTLVASVSGSTITIKSTTSGTSSNGIAVTTTSATDYPQYFSGPSFWGSPASTTLSGGTNATQNVYDSGTVRAIINGQSASVTFGSSSTPQTIAGALSTAIQNAAGSFLTASSDGDVGVLISDNTGSGTDWSVSLTVTFDNTDFMYPSFSATAYGMSGGSGADSSGGIIYSYFVPSGGYALNSDLLISSDSVMGDWNFGYDTLDRLVTAASAANAPPAYANNYGCWGYDAFGNRTSESMSTTQCGNSPPLLSWANYNSANNQVYSASTRTAGFFYDQAGNILNDGINDYWYDAEGRLCAVENPVTTIVTAYLYDAEGRRVAKGLLSALPSGGAAIGNVATNGSCGPNTASTSSFTLQSQYLLDLGGNQATELTGPLGSQTWLHSNVWAAGKILATYDSSGIHFPLTDPLGTKRIQAKATGAIDLTCISLPFGDGPPCTGDNATEHRFTGKERDAESGNDYFGARYYSSAMGRFMSPDWSAKYEPVPYAKLDNPQTLNLYAYMRNNPLGGVDKDGHSPDWWQKLMNGIAGNGLHTNAELAPKPGQFTVTLNSRAANIPGGSILHAAGADHEWVSTSDGKSVGMGAAKNGGQIPDKNGESSPDKPGAPTQLVDESGDKPTTTHTFTNVDKGAIDSYLTPGKATGPWIPTVNDCNTWAENAIGQSTPHDAYDRNNDTMVHNAVVYADGSIHQVQPQ